MKKRYRNQMKQIIAMLLVCAILTGLIPASLPETVHAAAVSAAEQEKWYEVTAKINSSWGGHIAGEITLTNNSEEAIQDWQIEFPWDAQITSMWCGNYEPTENGYIITPADYNRNLAAGASVNVGFLAEGEDSVLEGLVVEGFFENHGVHITTAEERENMPPEPSREPAPTLEATISPTVEPTATAAPTLEPTASSTLAPTLTATASPALESIASPTEESMVSLMLMPTATSTLEPMVSPTLMPTAAPTLEPTVSPTLEPTVSSTVEPTINPTLEPTASPTLEPTPTIAPTAEPTEEPAEDFYVYTDTTLTEDLICRNLFLMGGALTIKGCTITVVLQIKRYRICQIKRS